MDSGPSTSSQRHPLLCLVGQLRAVLDATDAGRAWTLTPSELTELLPELTRLKARLAAVELAVAAEADRAQVGDPVGAANTAAWWAHQTRMTQPAARSAMRLARTLEADRHRSVREALAAGDLLVAQARVITDAVDALPADLVEEQLRDRAEKHLVVLAAEHDAKELRILGQRVLEVLAPEVAEEVERRLLEQEERRARETARFSMSADGHGSVHGRFKIPALEGAMLRKHLEAIAAPRHRAATGDTTGSAGADGADGVSGPVARPLRLGQAFCEYVRTRDRQGTPNAGGVAATVTVTMSLAALLGAETAAGLDTGERISAAQARRLACEAGIIPVVLGGRSEPLDVGRARRFHTRAQRVVIGLRDGGCAADGCDWPPGMCHVHHQTPWSRGGRTNVDDAVMLCPRHHTIAHDARYQLKTGPSGKVTFSRRT